MIWNLISAKTSSKIVEMHLIQYGNHWSVIGPIDVHNLNILYLKMYNLFTLIKSNFCVYLSVSDQQPLAAKSIALMVLKFGLHVILYPSIRTLKQIFFCILKRGSHRDLLAHEKRIFFCLYRVAIGDMLRKIK